MLPRPVPWNKCPRRMLPGGQWWDSGCGLLLLLLLHPLRGHREAGGSVLLLMQVVMVVQMVLMGSHSGSSGWGGCRGGSTWHVGCALCSTSPGQAAPREEGTRMAGRRGIRRCEPKPCKRHPAGDACTYPAPSPGYCGGTRGTSAGAAASHAGSAGGRCACTAGCAARRSGGTVGC